MAEDKADQMIAGMREQFGSDGHFVENVAAMIASASANARDYLPRSISAIDANLKLGDALVPGRKNEIPEAIVHRLKMLSQIMGSQHSDVTNIAIQAGLLASDDQRRDLKTKGREDISVLREAVLKLRVMSKGSPAVMITLADAIKGTTK